MYKTQRDGLCDRVLQQGSNIKDLNLFIVVNVLCDTVADLETVFFIHYLLYLVVEVVI